MDEDNPLPTTRRACHIVAARVSVRVIGFVQARSEYQDPPPIVVTSPPN
jgi:hypothetical protein